MIEGIETYYQRIADGIVDGIPEDWRHARVEVVFYSECSDYDGEYTTDDGKERSFEVSDDACLAFRQLRKKFNESGKRVWGQATFELNADGSFNMKWGYDNCEENGDTIWDADEWSRKQNERRSRLTRP